MIPHPPVPMPTPDTKDVRVVIDSRARDREAYPTPSSYEVDLPEDLFTVHCARLLYAQVPFSSYTVPPGAAQRFAVLLSSGAALAVATLPSGDYALEDGAELATAVQAALDAAAAPLTGQTFRVTYDARRDSFDLRSTAEFTIDPSRLSAVAATTRLLGFGTASKTYVSSPSDDPAGTGHDHLIAAPYRRSTDPHPYVVMRMQVPSAETINSPLPAAHRAFAIIPKDQPANAVDDVYPFEKRWKPPLARVSRVKLAFHDPDGNPYDFQNQDHRIDILFKISTHRSLWND